MAVGFAGALIVARPGVSMDGDMVFALGADACMACCIVVTRAVARASPPLATLAFQHLSGALLLLLPALSHWSVPSSGAFLLILLMGLTAATSHLLVIGAFRLAEASALSPLIYFELVGTTIFGALVFGSFPSWATWIGIGLVVAGGLVLVERRTEPNRTAGLRRSSGASTPSCPMGTTLPRSSWHGRRSHGQSGRGSPEHPA